MKSKVSRPKECRDYTGGLHVLYEILNVSEDRLHSRNMYFVGDLGKSVSSRAEGCSSGKAI